MACGKRELGTVINMRENIYKIRNMVMEFLAGLGETFIRVTINKMFELGSDKCTG